MDTNMSSLRSPSSHSGPPVTENLILHQTSEDGERIVNNAGGDSGTGHEEGLVNEVSMGTEQGVGSSSQRNRMDEDSGTLKDDRRNNDTFKSIETSVDESILRDLKLRESLIQQRLDIILGDMEIYGPMHESLQTFLKGSFHCTEYDLQILRSLGFVSVYNWYTAAQKSPLEFINNFPVEDVRHPKLMRALTKGYCAGLIFKKYDTHMSQVKPNEATSVRFCSVLTTELAQECINQHYRRVLNTFQGYVDSHDQAKTSANEPSILGSTISFKGSRSTLSDISHKSSRSRRSKHSQRSRKSNSSQKRGDDHHGSVYVPKVNFSESYLTGTSMRPCRVSNLDEKEVRRQPLPARVKWGGYQQDFEEFQHVFEGHFQQCGAGYLFNQDFQERYKQVGKRCLEEFPQIAPGIRQFNLDLMTLYGAIRTASAKGIAKEFLLRHKSNQDGLSVWMGLVSECASDGDTVLRRQKLEIIISKRYTRHWSGGLTAWVQDYVNSFSELVSLGAKCWMDDTSKKERMLANVTPGIGMDHTVLIEMCRHKDFKETCKMLQSRDMWGKFLTQSSSIKKAKVEPQEVPKSEDKDGHEELSRVDIVAAQISKIPTDVWKQLPRTVQLEIIKARKNDLVSSQNSGPTSNAFKDKVNPEIPAQYSTAANQVAIDETSVCEEEVPSSGEDLEALSLVEQFLSQEDGINIQVNKVCVSECRITTKYYAKCQEVRGDISRKCTCIWDSGADTSVIGEGWYVESIQAHRKANIVGFEKEHAFKRDLHIVSAITVVEDKERNPVFIRINEAVHNPSQKHSLLSEYQVRDYGIKLDAVSRCHGGGQKVVFGQHEVPLNVVACMVSMDNRHPTLEELKHMREHVEEVVDITQGAVAWNPKEHTEITEFQAQLSHSVRHKEGCKGHSPSTSKGNTNMSKGEFMLKYYDKSDAQLFHPGVRVNLTWCPWKLEKAVAHNTRKGLDSILRNHPDKSRVVPTRMDPGRLAPYFLYRPREVIQKTLEKTTQMSPMVLHQPMQRHFKPRFELLRYKRLNEIISTDPIKFDTPSVDGYMMAQVFYGLTSRRRWVFPMKTESEFPEVYKDFIRQVGIPSMLRRDNAKSEDSEEIRDTQRKFCIKDGFSEPHYQHQNPVELNGIKYLKQHADVLMNRTGAPECMWLLALQHICHVTNLMADPYNGWKIPNQVAGGDEAILDISNILCFWFHQPVLYLDHSVKFPHSKEKPGFYGGISPNVGDMMTFKIVTANYKTILHRSVVRPADDPIRRNKRVTFGDEVDKRLSTLDGGAVDESVIMPALGTIETGKVQEEVAKRTRSKTADAVPVATRTRSRTVMKLVGEKCVVDAMVERSPSTVFFQTFQTKKSVGVKGLNPSQVEGLRSCCGDHERHLYKNSVDGSCQNDKAKLLEALAHDTTHQRDMCTDSLEYGEYGMERMWDVIKIEGHRHCGPRAKRRTELKCQWADPNHSTSWVDFYAVVLQDPVAVVRYARNRHLHSQKPFTSVVNYCLGDSPSYLARAFKAKVHPCAPKFKFGVEVPLRMKDAMRLDSRNGDTLWQEAINKELKQLNQYETFKAVNPGGNAPEGYKKIPYNIIFDVKFDGRRKARLVAGGHKTEELLEDQYSGVVAMETVRLGFIVGETNKLTCCAADIGNAYLYSKTREKVYIVAGPEFGDLEGRVLIINKALYGLRTSSCRFHEALSATLRSMGFRVCKSDRNLWMRDRGGYYEYLVTYVDDILAWSKDPMEIMKKLEEVYILKGVGLPEYYLGGNFETLGEHWVRENVGMAFSAKTYINNVIPKFEELFESNFKKVNTPMEENYHPECEDSPYVGSELASKFRSAIGSCNWVIILGRFDISYATSVLSRYSMSPRSGHINAVIRVMRYLKHYAKGKIIYDTSFPDLSKLEWEDHPNWKEIYPDAEEEIPYDMPSPKGCPVRILCYVDANHAHDVVTRRSVTGIVLLVNNTPVRWISKRQKTVETSTYGSELVAARLASELIMEVRYSLRMMGVPIDGPATLLGDNMSVVLNTTVPSSVLKKKHNAISYHRVRECIAGGIIRFAHISSEENIADILTKPLGGPAFYRLAKGWLFRVPRNSERIEDVRVK